MSLASSLAEKWYFNIETYILRKRLNFFVCEEDWILVEMWNIYCPLFQISLVQTCWLETTFFILITRLSVNKNFPKSHYIIKIKITVWLLCAHPIMACIISHTRRPNTQEKSVTYLVFMFQLMFIKSTLFTLLHFAPSVMY